MKHLVTLPTESIGHIEVYIRSKPTSCPFSKEAKALLMTHFKDVPLVVKDISSSDERTKHTIAKDWLALQKSYPTAKTIPQVIIHYFVDDEQRTGYVGDEKALKVLCEKRTGVPITPNEINIA